MVKSMLTGKKGSVAPIFKKGRKYNLGNCQPVSFTSMPGKVMEQIILEAEEHGREGGDMGEPAWLH